MILPGTYAATLAVLILSMICWGSWANTQKLTGRWRFELFYFDYTFGVLVTAVVAACTFGSLGFDGFLFMDDLMQTGRRNLAYGFGAGVITMAIDISPRHSPRHRARPGPLPTRLVLQFSAEPAT